MYVGIDPGSFIAPQHSAAIGAWSDYKEGHLPRAGGIGDQEKFFQVTNRYISGLQAEYEREELEKVKEAGKR